MCIRDRPLCVGLCGSLSVSEYLKKNNELELVGGIYFLTGLVEMVPTAAHVEKYAKIVAEKALLRNLIYLSHNIAKEAYDDSQDIADILESVEQSMFKITQNQLKGGFKQINPLIVDALDDLEEKRNKGGTVTGIPSGLLDLDDLKDYLPSKKPHYLILFSWHIKNELKRNLKKKGFKGKFIIPLPTPKIES